MNDISHIALTVFGIAGFAGGAVGYFAKGKADAVIALSAKENTLLKDDNTRLEKALAACSAEKDQLKAENNRLWGKAQGSDQLVSLTNEIKNLVHYIKDGRNRNGQ
jgi:uncharacterized membrane protein